MKNRTLRISLILAILTLVTSCFMGSTFAKYVTNTRGTDTARVAKFGVVITQTTAFDEAFAQSYATDDSVYSGSIANSVVTNPSGDGKDLVAPGTTGFIGVSIAGTPEVAVKVEYVLTGTDNIKYTDSDVITINGSEYPIKWTLTNNTTSAKVVENVTLEELKTAVDGLSAEYGPNEDLAASYTITWAWAFEQGATAEEKAKVDAADTVLGDAGTAEINFTLTVTVTQID